MNNTASQMELNRRFEIPGIAKLVEGNGGLPAVRITSPRAHGEVYLHGAHVTSWRPASAEEVLFLSPNSRWQAGSAIRGGVPICFPWFGDRLSDPKSPAHGFVRAKSWELDSIVQRDNTAIVTLSTQSDENSRKLWPVEFRALLKVSFGDELRMELIVSNRGSAPFDFEAALHSYFRVGDATTARISGLDESAYIDKTDAGREKPQQGDIVINAQTDRIYRNSTDPVMIEDDSLKRCIKIAKENSHDTVVWNPWSEKAAAMSDLGESHWREFVCVETCNVGGNAVHLAPGGTHNMAAIISVAPF